MVARTGLIEWFMLRRLQSPPTAQLTPGEKRADLFCKFQEIDFSCPGPFMCVKEANCRISFMMMFETFALKKCNRK